MASYTNTRAYGDENAAVTVVEVNVNDLYFTTSASSKRHPNDQADPTIGELLATGRALIKAGRQMLSLAWNTINERNGR